MENVELNIKLNKYLITQLIFVYIKYTFVDMLQVDLSKLLLEMLMLTKSQRRMHAAVCHRAKASTNAVGAFKSPCSS